MLQYNTSFIDNKGIIGILRRSCNYVDKRLMDHGLRVSYIMFRLLSRMPALPPGELRDLCFLGALHDIGAYKTEEIDRLVQFETSQVWGHSVYGYLFVKYFSPLSQLAPAVLFHHMPWDALQNESGVTPAHKRMAQLISLADRLDIWLNTERRPYGAFLAYLSVVRGTCFEASLVDLMTEEPFSAFTAEEIESDLAFQQMQCEPPFTHEQIHAYLRMIIYSIDFRSRHTVTHTMTTTSISNELALLAGLDPGLRSQVVCGALLHDLGKIGIPDEILEYPGKLSPQAMSIMRTHVEITADILGDDIPLPIRHIALCHHEKLDGSGYPNHLTAKDLGTGERIVALADIVSALAGTRSYKEAFDKERIVSIVSGLRRDGLVDASLVDCLFAHYDAIMDKTARRCRPLWDIYQSLYDEYALLYAHYAGAAASDD